MLHRPYFCRHSLICQFHLSDQQLFTDDVVTYEGYMDVWCSYSNSFQYIVVWPCAFGSGMILVTCVDGWCQQTSFICYDTMCSDLLVKLTLACCFLGTWSVGPLNLHFHLTSLLPFSTTWFDLVNLWLGTPFWYSCSQMSVLCVQWNPRSHMSRELLVSLGIRWVNYPWLIGTHFTRLQELCLSWWLRVGPPCPLMYVKGWVILYVLKVKVILMYSKAKTVSYVYLQ